jgi:hypothetical protein
MKKKRRRRREGARAQTTREEKRFVCYASMMVTSLLPKLQSVLYNNREDELDFDEALCKEAL